MNESWIYAIIIVLAVAFIKEAEKRKMNRHVIRVDNHEREVEVSGSFAGHYKAKKLLTQNEWIAYKRLKQIADKRFLVICPKVRLLDIVEPKPNDPKWSLLMNKIKSKHVDFVICDLNLHILGVVELDDLTHDSPDRQLRDQFVDEILLDVGYTVIHTRYVNEHTLDPIIEKLGR